MASPGVGPTSISVPAPTTTRAIGSIGWVHIVRPDGSTPITAEEATGGPAALKSATKPVGVNSAPVSAPRIDPPRPHSTPGGQVEHLDRQVTTGQHRGAVGGEGEQRPGRVELQVDDGAGPPPHLAELAVDDLDHDHAVGELDRHAVAERHRLRAERSVTGAQRKAGDRLTVGAEQTRVVGRDDDRGAGHPHDGRLEGLERGEGHVGEPGERVDVVEVDPGTIPHDDVVRAEPHVDAVDGGPDAAVAEVEQVGADVPIGIAVGHAGHDHVATAHLDQAAPCRGGTPPALDTGSDVNSDEVVVAAGADWTGTGPCRR